MVRIPESFLLVGYQERDTDVCLHGFSQELVPSWANFKIIKVSLFCRKRGAILNIRFGEQVSN